MMENSITLHKAKIGEIEYLLANTKSKRRKDDLYKHLKRLKKELRMCENYLRGDNGKR